LTADPACSTSTFVLALVPLSPLSPKGKLSAGLGEDHPDLETFSQVSRLQELSASPSSTGRVGVGWEPGLSPGAGTGVPCSQMKGMETQRCLKPIHTARPSLGFLPLPT